MRTLLLFAGGVGLATLLSFAILLEPHVIRFSSPPSSSLRIEFDRPVRRQEIQATFSPAVHGTWQFESPMVKNHFFRTLIFTPALEYEPGTSYALELKGIKGFGLQGSSSFSLAFRTDAPPVVKAEPANKASLSFKQERKPTINMLPIAVDWQDSPLSCEAASLKMALSYKGVVLDEKMIMEKIGYDTTEARKGDTWGDPHKGFVGDINGKICTSGFGVFWDAVARAADNWKDGVSFSGWSIQDLTRELAEGNPVLAWGTLPRANLRECSWHTKEGRYIKAFYETHVRLAIGFIGAQENPEQIILNDPIAGRLYWSTSMFEKNWSTFGYSGVAIR